ncbi:hypothetical protein V5799_008730 [Amblyomma americanum]|uniref:Uncharacterized protein n=1 Tax=Amblyomma americanum TaxID=6943 RepID=A0AAQ4FDV2_AMBAM
MLSSYFDDAKQKCCFLILGGNAGISVREAVRSLGGGVGGNSGISGRESQRSLGGGVGGNSGISGRKAERSLGGGVGHQYARI